MTPSLLLFTIEFNLYFADGLAVVPELRVRLLGIQILRHFEL